MTTVTVTYRNKHNPVVKAKIRGTTKQEINPTEIKVGPDSKSNRWAWNAQKIR